MSRSACVVFCALLALSLLNPTICYKRSGGGSRHSYPSSHGLSGGGHSYPKSHGLSGTGGGHISPSHVSQSHSSSHGYPSSGGGLSGSNHGYPSSGGGLSGSNHGYPSSGGGLSGSNHGYPSSGGGLSGSNNGYPNRGSSSSNHGYPASPGLSGNVNHPKSSVTVNNYHNYHYNYNPPRQVSYRPPGGAPMSYPVYQHPPPAYVYQYKQSGSKYSTLLAGLALLNLGVLGANIAMMSRHSSSGSYKPAPGEYCKFGIRKENGDYEETKITCDLITSFIWEEEAKQKSGGSNITTVTSTVTNTTIVNTTNDMPGTLQVMLPNGTLVNSTDQNNNQTANQFSTSIVTTTTVTNSTQVVDALDPKLKGPEVQVTSGMKCYVIRVTPATTMKKTVPCGLLQTYATSSLKRNSASQHVPTFTLLAVAMVIFVMN